MNTSRQRRLTDSKYNERRAECDAVLRLLGTDAPRNGLVHAEWADLLSHVSDPVLQRRARHVISEQTRVEQASHVLAAGDLAAFGKLLTESHASLRDDYEVTGPYLDAIVGAALQAPGCLGARMTGAGFGGCAIALVEQDEFRPSRLRFDPPTWQQLGSNLRSMRHALLTAFTRQPGRHRMENVRGKLTYRRDGVVMTLDFDLIGKSENDDLVISPTTIQRLPPVNAGPSP